MTRFHIGTRAIALSLALSAGCGLLESGSPSRGTAANALLWHVGGKPGLGPAAFDGTHVFFATAGHTIIALNPANGDQVWSARADTGAVGATGSSFAGCSVSSGIVACGDDGDVVAFAPATGAFLWRFHPLVGGRADWNPSVSMDSTIYCGSGMGGALYAVNIGTGGQRWVATVPGLATGGLVLIPAADTGLVVVPYVRPGKPTTGGLFAVDARTGQVRWNTSFPRIAPDSDTGGSSVVLWRDLALASAQSGRIFAFDRQSGSILWSLPGVGTRPPSSVLRNVPMTSDVRALVADGSHLYASSEAGWFIGYDLLTHRELWRTDPGIEGSQGSPIVTDGVGVYVVYLTGTVAVFSTADGSLRSMASRPGGPLIVGVALALDRFFVPGDDGFYAYAK